MKTSIARQIGCRPPWDILSSFSVPVCDTLEKIYDYEQLDYEYMIYEQKIVLNLTKCLIPCKYKQYKMVEEPLTGPATFLGPRGKQGYISEIVQVIIFFV